MDAVLVAFDHRRVGGHRQHRPEWVEQHVGGDGFAEVDVPDVFAFDRAVVNLGEIEAAPRFFVLCTAAGADPHDIGGDAGIGFFLLDEEEAAGDDGRALAGAFAVGRGVAAGGIAEGDIFALVGAAFGAEPLGGRGGQAARCAATLAGLLFEPFGEDHAAGDGEEGVWLDSFEVPRLAPSEVGGDAVPSAGAPLAVLPGLQGALGHDHPDAAADLEVEVDAAGEEEAGDVLVGGVAAAGPDAVERFALAFELAADDGLRLVVGEPGRVADDGVDLRFGEHGRAHHVAGVVAPDVIAAFGVERLHRGDGLLQHSALGHVLGNALLVERVQRIVAVLDGLRDLDHGLVEPVGLLDEREGEVEMAVVVIVDFDADAVAGEEVLAGGAELEGVAEVDGGDGCDGDVGVPCPFEGASCGEGPGGAGEVDGDGVDVDALDLRGEPVEGAFGAPVGFAGGGEEAFDGGVDEGAGAAGGVEHGLFERLPDDLVDDGAGEPERGVVLAQPAPVFGGDDGFVEDAGDVGFGVAPIEVLDAAGHALQPALAADFGGPAEEVGFDDAADAGFVLEDAALDQVGGFGGGLGEDVDAEGALDGEADDDGEVGVAEEESVEVGFLLDGDAERGGEQPAPEFALDADGFAVAVGVVERAEFGEVLLEARAGAEPAADLVIVGGDAAGFERLRDVGEPAVEVEPAVGGLELVCVLRVGAEAGHVGPAGDPVAPVGEDADALRERVVAGGGEVAVELVDVVGIGLETWLGADPPLELEDHVGGGEVAASAVAGRCFDLDLGGRGQLDGDEEVARGGADVVLGLSEVVAFEDGFGGGVRGGIVRSGRHERQDTGAYPAGR